MAGTAFTTAALAGAAFFGAAFFAVLIGAAFLATFFGADFFGAAFLATFFGADFLRVEAAFRAPRPVLRTDFFAGLLPFFAVLAAFFFFATPSSCAGSAGSRIIQSGSCRVETARQSRSEAGRTASRSRHGPTASWF